VDVRAEEHWEKRKAKKEIASKQQHRDIIKEKARSSSVQIKEA
jgi:hypothetical protein